MCRIIPSSCAGLPSYTPAPLPLSMLPLPLGPAPDHSCSCIAVPVAVLGCLDWEWPPPCCMLLSPADSLCRCRYILSNVATGLKALPSPGEGYDDDLSDPSSEDVSAATRLDKVGSSRCWQGARHVQSWPWLTSRPLWGNAAVPRGRRAKRLHHGGLTAQQPLGGDEPRRGEGGAGTSSIASLA